MQLQCKWLKLHHCHVFAVQIPNAKLFFQDFCSPLVFAANEGFLQAKSSEGTVPLPSWCTAGYPTEGAAVSKGRWCNLLSGSGGSGFGGGDQQWTTSSWRTRTRTGRTIEQLCRSRGDATQGMRKSLYFCLLTFVLMFCLLTAFQSLLRCCPTIAVQYIT